MNWYWCYLLVVHIGIMVLFQVKIIGMYYNASEPKWNKRLTFFAFMFMIIWEIVVIVVLIDKVLDKRKKRINNEY